VSFEFGGFAGLGTVELGDEVNPEPKQDHQGPNGNQFYGQSEFVPHRNLRFDPENPRFLRRDFDTEDSIISRLYTEFDVDEVIQSILSAGYLDFEPLIVLREGLIVLEGSRRLAALRLITDPQLRERLKINLPDIAPVSPIPDAVRVRWVDSRAEARNYIGFKHINGPFKWDALAKAKYAAEWFKEGADIGTISRTLGDNHNTVRRLVSGWLVLQQAIEDGFDTAHISKKSFAFSHLYTALARGSVRDFLGLAPEDLMSMPQPNPVPNDHEDELQTLMSWLYGQEQRSEPTIIESQNPNLNQLVKVLAKPEARLMLIATRNLKDAFDRVEPAAVRFGESLMLVARQAEETVGLSGSYEGDPTLLAVAEGLERTSHSLVVVMREKAKSVCEQS
jgi:hypothetical protein